MQTLCIHTLHEYTMYTYLCIYIFTCTHIMYTCPMYTYPIYTPNVHIPTNIHIYITHSMYIYPKYTYPVYTITRNMYTYLCVYIYTLRIVCIHTPCIHSLYMHLHVICIHSLHTCLLFLLLRDWQLRGNHHDCTHPARVRVSVK